ncbi:MAG: transporter [Acidobacteria bacterium]|jgi:tol-pal system protein YbgF|nr:MAG: transporter [Acidobacteriota bacterium]PYX11771.1 MAG: transporter [Acidobacteriota bacterium]PYX17113.1 MAG: transporter [Acidobacteriota bacterium]
MRIQRLLTILVLLSSLWLATPSAWGISREIVQLQTQVQALQDQMTHMQQSFDERMGVMKNLVEQSTDSMNKVAASVTDLQGTLQKQQTDSGSHVDQLSGQIQALNDTLDELKARLAKVSKQLEDMQAAQQNVAAQQSQQTQQQQQQTQAPPPDVLYNNALRDYNAAKNDLAAQEFADYVKYYPNTDLAGNAYFYLADLEFRQGNYQQAVKDYDQVLQNFPTGNKAPAAQLKKGFALLELGQKDSGIAELRRLIQRYPRSNEALQARDRLRKLGVPATGTTARKMQ